MLQRPRHANSLTTSYNLIHNRRRQPTYLTQIGQLPPARKQVQCCSLPPPASLPILQRRHLLGCAWLIAVAGSAEAKERRRLWTVGEDDDFKTIGEALRAANSGDAIAISPGLYKEQLILDKSIKLLARDNGVSVEWRTDRPYESTLECMGVTCEVRGLNITHSSPSVANNYAIMNQGGDLRLYSCTVNSATGSGIATEGGALTVRDSNISNNRGNGVVCIASLQGDRAECKVIGSRIGRNNLNGLLVQEDSRLILKDSAVSYNRQYGVRTKDADLEEEGNVYAMNTRGSISQTQN